MRKIYLLVLLLALGLLGHDLAAQCTVTITPALDTICVGGSTTLTANTPVGSNLNTTMAAGNNHRGNMFDITALNTVTITSFDASPMATTDMAIYYRVGTFVGFETSSTGWTLLGTATGVVPIGSPTPTPIPIPVNVTIPAGQTYGFYVSSSNTAVSLNYTNGTTLGAVYASDANIQFREGKGMEYPFCNGGTPFSPRVWNGRINYSTGGAASYLWSNGATTSSITVAPTATSSYTVTATATGTCTATATLNVGAPAVSLGPDTMVCGSSPITLDAGSGYSYLWSTSATSQSVLAGTGSYWVQVTDAFGCTDTDSIAILQSPGPSVNLGADSVICGLGTWTLDAGSGGASYLWSTGSTAQTLTVTQSGSYDVQVTDSAGCTSGDTVSLAIGNPAVFIGNDTTLCNAASTILDAGSGWASVLWSNGSTNDFINVNAANTYSVQVTDSVGCSSSDSIVVATNTIPFASFSITNSPTCTEVAVSNGSLHGTSFLWIWGDGNTSSGQNPAPHTYTAPYTGNVTLIVSNACGADTLVVSTGCVGVTSPQGLVLQVSPNPNNGRLNLTAQGLPAEAIALTIMDLRGQIVWQQALDAPGGALAQALDLSALAQGSYILRALAGEQRWSQRIIIQH